MVDWAPVIAALAVFIVACASAVPGVVAIFQHRATQKQISSNAETLGEIRLATNGTLSDMQAALRSLRAEVVRLNGLVDAGKAEKALGPTGPTGSPGTPGPPTL